MNAHAGKSIVEQEMLDQFMKKQINYIVRTQGWSGIKVTECETVAEARKALGNCSFGALTSVRSPTGKDISQFVPF